MNKPRILFTGGGTAGHVIPNLVLIKECLKLNYHIDYIGSYDGIERQLLQDFPTVKYHAIYSGKLRRYWSWQNFIDPFKIIIGFFQALFIILQSRPKLVFSKGGFVSFPVVLAAWCCRIPVWIHESDLTPGLANKLSFPFARKICITFSDTKLGKYSKKKFLTGAILRPELFTGDAQRGREFCQINSQKPVILVMGGSQGAKRINTVLREAVPQVLQDYAVIHICGAGMIDHSLDNLADYRQYEYINKELPDIMALATLVITRSGSNSVHEFLALKKPHIFIPLPAIQSRGDQVQNAAYYTKLGTSITVNESDLSVESLLRSIEKCYLERDILVSNMDKLPQTMTVHEIISLLACIPI
jgi:UDP-N-acetylglucosamine--N-acetylmuramyl-(pentapeptide) pyrophosphoryl-undecaprenol N-acetylglucosamine transferase